MLLYYNIKLRDNTFVIEWFAGIHGIILRIFKMLALC